MATGWYVVEPPTEGLLNAVKGQPATALMIGQNTYSGSFTAAIRAALANFQGGQFVSGVASMLAKKPTASMNGIFYNSANLAATTKKATAAMVGTSQNRAALVSIIARATAALNGSQIAIGTIAATAAKASAAMGKILSSNFVINGSFEAGTSGWSGWNANVILDTTTSVSGSASAKEMIPADGSDQQLTQNVPGPFYPGDYLVGLWMKNEKIGSVFGLQISYVPAAGGTRLIWGLAGGGNWATNNNIAAYSSSNTLEWQYKEVVINLPEVTNASGIQLGLKRNAGPSVGEAYAGWFDDVSIRQYLDANSALGNIPVTLPTAQASLAGNLVHSGILSGMFKPIGAALAGYQNPQGTIAATVAKAIVQANGGQNIPGTFAVALAKAQAAIASEQAQAGTASMSAKAATFGATSINPPTFNSVGASASNANSFISSLTASENHVLAAGTRRYAVAAMTYRSDAQNPDPTNQTNNRVQWGGADMALIDWVQVNSTTGLAIYGYAIPDSDAAGTVSVAFRTGKAANTGRSVSGLSVVYNGSSGVLLDAYAENGVGATPLVMASTTNEIALGTFGAVSSLTGVAGTGQTVRGNTNGGGGFTAVSLIDAPGDTSVSFAATGAKAAYGVRVLA